MTIQQDVAIRQEWGRRIAQTLADQGLGPTDLANRLTETGLYPVTSQGVGGWISGKWAPRPSAQVAIARALGVPPQALFELPEVA